MFDHLLAGAQQPAVRDVARTAAAARPNAARQTGGASSHPSALAAVQGGKGVGEVAEQRHSQRHNDDERRRSYAAGDGRDCARVGTQVGDDELRAGGNRNDPQRRILQRQYKTERLPAKRDLQRHPGEQVDGDEWQMRDALQPRPCCVQARHCRK